MKTPAFEVHMPKTLDHALEIAKDLHEGGHDFDWISGGTDLIPNYKWGINPKSHVISMSGVSELEGISTTRIGAMVRLQDIVESSVAHPVDCRSSGDNRKRDDSKIWHTWREPVLGHQVFLA